VLLQAFFHSKPSLYFLGYSSPCNTISCVLPSYDEGFDGDAQRISQMGWMLFTKKNSAPIRVLFSEDHLKLNLTTKPRWHEQRLYKY
jgi:hypothetical protein